MSARHRIRNGNFDRPFTPTTQRSHQIAGRARDRVLEAVADMRGTIRALRDEDMGLAAAAMDDDVHREAMRRLTAMARELHAIRRRLDGARAKEEA